MKFLFLAGVKGYQRFISPLSPRRCRYEPSCSTYTVQCIESFGLGKGLVLGAWRLLRCNPLSLGGYDPPQAQHLFREKK